MENPVQEAVVRAVGDGLDISPVDVIELALQHAVKAGQLTARQFAALIRQGAQEHRESALNGREVRIRVRCARRQCPSHAVGLGAALRPGSLHQRPETRFVFCAGEPLLVRVNWHEVMVGHAGDPGMRQNSKFST